MRRLLAPLLAVAMMVGLLSAAPLTASAAPPTAAWAGAAGGDTTAVDLSLTGLSLTNARLATSQADSGSQRTPNRSTARSANLGAAVAGLGLGVAQNVETAGPPNGTSTSSPGLAATAAGVVSVGALQVTDTASWAGDNTCYTSGPLAFASTRTAGVRVTPAVVPLVLLTTGASTTTGTTELAATGTGSANGVGYGVRSTATGTIADVSVLGVGIGIAGGSTLRTTANATGTSATYDPGTVTVTSGGTTRTVGVGSTDNVSLNLGGAVTATVGVKVNALPTPTTTATSITAAVSVVTVSVVVKTAGVTTLSSTIDLLPLRSSASVPVGGIDCPAPVPAAPVVTTPANGSRTNDTTPTYSGTGIAGATVNLTVDGTRTANVATVAADGTWTYTPANPIAEGQHRVSATQTRFGTESLASNQNTFTVDLTAPAAPVLATPANLSVTNDRTPTYTGTAEAGSTVRVYEGTTLLGTGTATGGTFSIDSDQLAPGPHTVFAQATDVAGNASASSNANTFTIDTTAPPAPVITVPLNGTTTTDTTPTISGTAEPGATVRVRVDGNLVGTTTANAGGAWTLDSSVLGQGAHTATAVATDPAGNDSGASNAVDFTVDSVAPAAPVITVPADQSSTNDTTPTISGTAEAGASVAVRVDGTFVGTATAGGNGRFEVTPATPLAEGPHTTTAVATDAGGNISPTSAPVRFSIDTATPVAPTLATPANGTATADRTPTYTGTAEPGSTVRVYEGATLLGTGQATAGGTYAIVSGRLAEGPHTVRARSTDAAGNVSADSNANTFTVDGAAPAAPVITVPADGSSTTDTTPTITGTAEGNASVEVFVDGRSVGTATANATGGWTLDSTPLSEGDHRTIARATDAAGNVSGPSSAVDFTVDTTAPATPAITAPADGSTVADPTPAISGTAEPGSSVVVTLDGTPLPPVTATAGGTFSVTPPAPLAETAHTATAVATDAAGNPSPVSAPVTFIVDATAPAAPVILVPVDGSSTNDTTPTISGTAEELATVEVFVDGRSVGTTAASATGAWSLNSTALAQGRHTATARATDAAGNRSAESNATRFTVDSVAPDAPVIRAPRDGAVVATPTPVISGTAEPGVLVTVTVDGTPVGTATADPNGMFSVTPPNPLGDGTHTATAAAVDPAGNASPVSAPVTFVVDSEATAPVLLTPANGSVGDDPTPTYTGTAEPGSTVRVYEGTRLVGTGEADEGGSFTIESAPLVEGPHTVVAQATGPGGAVSADSNALTFVVDVTDPGAPVIVVPADGSSTNDTTPTISGTAEAYATVQVQVDALPVQTTTADAAGGWALAAPTLGDGPHTATAVAVDAAGNTSDPSAPTRFTVDTAAPGVPALATPADGSSTNDTTPTYTGTAEAGATVQVYEGTRLLGTGTTTEGGTFSIISVPLAEGQHTVVARATDAAGNVSGDSNRNTFRVDVTAPAQPVITVPVDGSSTTDPTPVVSGTAEPNATVQVSVDGLPVGTTTASATGAWTLESTTLAQGPHVARATATDAAGNVSVPSAPVNFTVDSLAPAQPAITTPTDGSTTDDPTPTISGTAEAGSSVVVTLDGEPLPAVTATPEGTFSVTPPEPLGDGPHTAAAVATDGAGNASPVSDPVDFAVDTVVPATPVLATPADGSSTNDRRPTYTGTAEAGTTVRVYEGATLVGTGTAVEGDTFSIVSDRLATGSHTVLVRATDAAGNVSADSNANTFTIDTTRPARPVILVPTDGSATNDLTPTISGTAEPDASVQVFVDTVSVGTVQADGTGAWALGSSVLSPGPHTATAVATDAAGNVSPVSDGVDFTVDTAAPAAPVITAPADGAELTDPTPAIVGTAEPGATVEVFLDGNSVGTDVADEDGSFSVTPRIPLGNGPHTATAMATDPAGNQSPVSTPVTFTVDDTTAPDAPVITSPVDGSSTSETTPTISGTAEPGAEVTVSVDGAVVGMTTADENGDFSFVPTVPLTEGPHDVTAVATDPAGNDSPVSDPISVTIDTSTEVVTTTPADGSTITDDTPTLSGTAEPGDQVEVFVDGESVGTVAATGSSTARAAGDNWSLVSESLEVGEHTVYAVATDDAGNTATSNTNTFQLVDEGDGSGDGNGNGNGGGNGGGNNGGGDNGSGNGNGNGNGGHLASTGGPSLLIGLAALLLVGAGSTTVAVSRRRRRRG